MKFRSTLAAVAVAVFAALPASAQQQGSGRDADEIKSYRLTMDGLRKMATAGENLAKAVANDPRYKAELALKKEIDELEKKDELSEAESKKLDDLRAKLEEMEEKNSGGDDASNNQTLDQIAQRIEKEPVMAKAIRDAGLTPREYTLMGLVTFQAMMVHGMQKQFGNKELPADVAKTVLADNVKFVAANEAEITKLLERMQKLEKK